MATTAIETTETTINVVVKAGVNSNEDPGSWVADGIREDVGVVDVG